MPSPSPCAISADAAIRLISPPPCPPPPPSSSSSSSVHHVTPTSITPPPLIVDARTPALFMLEHVCGAVQRPSTAQLNRASHVLVYDSGTHSLTGPVTPGTQLVDLLQHQLDKDSTTVISLISGGISTLKYIAPHIIQHMYDKPSSLSSVISPSSATTTTSTTTTEQQQQQQQQYHHQQHHHQHQQSADFQHLLQCMSPSARRILCQSAWARSAFLSCALEFDPPARVLPALYVGAVTHALDSDWLRRHHITHILSAGHEAEFGYTTSASALRNSSIHWRRIAVRDCVDEDIGRHFRTACEFLDDARARRGTTIVHCMAGSSRSVALVIGYLVFHGWSVDDALQHIKMLRRAANPNETFMQQLYEWEAACQRQGRTSCNNNSHTKSYINNNNNNNNNINASVMNSNDGHTKQCQTPGTSLLLSPSTSTSSATREHPFTTPTPAVSKTIPSPPGLPTATVPPMTMATDVTSTPAAPVNNSISIKHTHSSNATSKASRHFCGTPVMMDTLQMDAARNDCLLSLEVSSRHVTSPRRITDCDLFSGSEGAMDMGDEVERRDSR